MPIYGFLKKEEKEHYKKLLTIEIDSFLTRIYKKMKRTAPLKKPLFNSNMLILKTAASPTKSYEFKLNKKHDVARGKIGTITLITNGLKEPMIRKQRALFIAAELYVYHAFANHPNPKYFDSIKNQNQYLDTIKRLFGSDTAHDKRDRAIRYIIEEVDEHQLAHMKGFGWHVGISKVKTHDHHMADLLGTSEKTFNKILKKQNQVFTPDMLKGEENLVRKEIEEIKYLIDILEVMNEPDKKTKHHRLQNHLDTLKVYIKTLKDIKDNLHRWYIDDKQEHRFLKKGVISAGNINHLIKAEKEAEMIDINKVYLLFQHFEKEKINILKDIESISGRTL